MKYMLMIYTDEKCFGGLSREEQNRVHLDCYAWHQELVQRGQARGAMALHAPSMAATVRLKNGKPVVTDGPFAEAKEVLGGFEIVECKDIDEAIAIARRFPALVRWCRNLGASRLTPSLRPRSTF